MHYYKRNLGDYAKKAGRLTMLQHGAYTLLIDACYDRELFPTRDEAIDWTWASSTAEIEAVDFVLRKFFVLENGRYVQKRIQEEIDAYHQTSETNKRIAEEREAKRRAASTDRARTVDGACTARHLTKNQEPRTNNQEPEGTFSDNSVGAAGAAHTSTQSPGHAPAKAETSPRATMLPADWQLPKSWGEWALAEFSHWTADDVRLEADKFADHWRAKSGKEARKADWQATWRNWCRSDIAQRAHPLPRVGRAGAPQMTDEQRQAFNASAREEARRLLFGDAPPADDLIENPTLELGHEAS